MKDTLFLAAHALTWYRGRSLTIIACLALTMWLPMTVRIMLSEFRAEITARGDATPLLVGSVQSRIDLALHALYFEGFKPVPTSMAEVDRIQATGYADAIPIHASYRTQSRNDQPGAVIVGTDPEYFEFRDLKVSRGQQMAILGDCVVGSSAARRLGLEPGDSILSASENAFDLAGDYPLKLNVTGVLEAAHSPDDNVVFVDLRTVWIIEGIGHGHQQLSSESGSDLLLKSDQQQVTASAAVLPYTEITTANIDSFHFHGDPADFPVTAVIAVPNSDRDRILLRGRYEGRDALVQCLQPAEVVGELLEIVFRVEQLVRISSLVAFAVTAVLLSLVLSLSLRLRQAEMDTMFRLGCSRGMIAGMLATELAIMLSAAISVAASAAVLSRGVLADALRQLLF